MPWGFGKSKKKQDESDLVAPTRPNLAAARAWQPTGSATNLNARQSSGRSPNNSGSAAVAVNSNNNKPSASSPNLMQKSDPKSSRNQKRPSSSKDISANHNNSSRALQQQRQQQHPPQQQPPPPNEAPPQGARPIKNYNNRNNPNNPNNNPNNPNNGNNSGSLNGADIVISPIARDVGPNGPQAANGNNPYYGGPGGGMNQMNQMNGGISGISGIGGGAQKPQQMQQYPARTNDSPQGYQRSRQSKRSSGNSEGGARLETGGGGGGGGYNNNQNYGQYGGNNGYSAHNAPRGTNEPPNNYGYNGQNSYNGYNSINNNNGGGYGGGAGGAGMTTNGYNRPMRPNKRDSEMRAQYGGMTSPGGEFIATHAPLSSMSQQQMKAYPNLNAPHPSADQAYNPAISAPPIDDEMDSKYNVDIEPFDTAGSYPALEKRGPATPSHRNKNKQKHSKHAAAESKGDESEETSSDSSESESEDDDSNGDSQASVNSQQAAGPHDDGKVVSLPKSGNLDLDNIEVIDEKDAKEAKKQEKLARKEAKKQEKLKKKQQKQAAKEAKKRGGLQLKNKNSNALSEASADLSKNDANAAGAGAAGVAAVGAAGDIIIPPAEVEDEKAQNANAANAANGADALNAPPGPAGVAEAEPLIPPPTESEHGLKGLSEQMSLEAWLEQIGFKKGSNKQQKMMEALDDMGIEDMDDLIMFLTDLYKNSYGQMQKTWIDKLQAQLGNKGIKWAAQIRFTKEAQKLLDQQRNKSAQVVAGSVQNQAPASLAGASAEVTGAVQVQQPTQPPPAIPEYEIGGSGRQVVMIQEEESKFLHQLQIAMMNMKDAIERVTKCTLGVEANQQYAVDAVTKEFDNVKNALDVRRDKLINNINAVAQDKFKVLDDQNSSFRAVLADYQESMKTFNDLISNNDRGSHSKEALKKRIRTIDDLVTNTLSQHRSVILTPYCTPNIGFHCDISPIVKEVVQVGTVTWGNPPDKPSIVSIEVTDWCIKLEWMDRSPKEVAKSNSVVRDPVIMYEIQCVICQDENNLEWNFDRFRRNTGVTDENMGRNGEKEENKKESKKSKKKSKKEEKRDKIKQNAVLQGVVSKFIPHKQIVLAGFVQHNIPYCVRIRGENRNGWGEYSFIKYLKTSKKKKRKEKPVVRIRIANHYGHQQDSGPENLLISGENKVYNSLSNADFIIAEQNKAAKLKTRDPVVVKDWIVFDLGTLVELSIFKIKFNMATRWSNVPRLIYIEIADYDANMDLIYGYRPVNDDLFQNNLNKIGQKEDNEDPTEEDEEDSVLTEKDISEIKDENELDPAKNEEDGIKEELARVEKEAREEMRRDKEKKRLERAERRRRKRWEQEQIEAKKKEIMYDKEQREMLFERLWRRIAVLEAKKKQGWQEFYFDDIDKLKRRAKYVRVSFVENFGCSIETYCRYVVEQTSFSGIVFDFDK